ncbi:MAG: DNA methylase [Snowella sp.]|nr:MAG: DNA methylase [Snowella sp.]
MASILQETNIEVLNKKESPLEVYLGQGKPSVPHNVTPDTPLAELNLNWTENDLPEKERTKHVHRLHPYLGKFIPQIAEIFLRKFFHPDQTVLDPFSGSGTTLVQANELGINAIGYDVSGFNVLLAKVKTNHYELKNVRQEIFDILNKTEQMTQHQGYQLSLWNLNILPTFHESSEYLTTWFAPQSRNELLTYRDLIGQYKNQDILKIILSRSARSARLTTHFDLDFPKKPQLDPYWCYKHGRNCSPTETAYQFLKRYSIDTIDRIEKFALLRTNSTVEVHHTDSRIAKIPPIDGVITSPPYVGLIDYHQQHKYAYELLEIEEHRELEIGSAQEGSSQKAQLRYQESIAKVFTNLSESIPSGGYLIVIAGDKYNLYPTIAKMCDVEEEAVLQRHVNRRTGRRSSKFYESVFIWKKK